MNIYWGTWVAPSNKHHTLDLDPGLDLRVGKFEPRIGLCTDSVEPAWDSLSLPLSLSLPDLCYLSLKINKYT